MHGQEVMKQCCIHCGVLSKTTKKKAAKCFLTAQGRLGGKKIANRRGEICCTWNRDPQKKEDPRGKWELLCSGAFVYKDVSYEGNANTLHTDLFSWQKKTMKSWTPIPQIIACTSPLDSIAEPIEQGTAICTIVC